MPVIVINMANGITSAVKKAARKLPKRTNSTTMTRSAPSNRLVWTVCKVLSTNLVRSYTAVATIPSGRLALISFSFSPTAWATVRLFSPINMNTVLMTTSRPFCVAAPVRKPWPFSMSATSLMVSAEPLVDFSGIRPIAAISSACPGILSSH